MSNSPESHAYSEMEEFMNKMGGPIIEDAVRRVLREQLGLDVSNDDIQNLLDEVFEAVKNDGRADAAMDWLRKIVDLALSEMLSTDDVRQKTYDLNKKEKTENE